MKCPLCQQDNPTAQKFCGECGTPLPPLERNAQRAPSYADLQRSLNEALEQQTATAEILRVISSSPTNLQTVMNVVAENAARVCGAADAVVQRLEEGALQLVASFGDMPAAPTPLDRGAVSGRAVIDRAPVHVHDIMAAEAEFPWTAAAARLRGSRTYLAVPLLREGIPIGVIGIRRREVLPFSVEQIKLLQTFADQAVIAIENVRLFKQLQASNRELTDALERQTATSEILGVISRSPTDIQPVLDAVAESATRLCAAHDAIIFRRDGDVLRRVAHCGPIPAPVGFAIPASRTRVTGRAVLDGQPIQVVDAQAKSEDFPETEFFAREHGFRTILSVPLLREGVAIGTMDLRRTQVQPFTETQIALLQTFADQAVIAIENVRLFKQLDARNRDLTATSAILQVISSSPTDVQPVFDAIVANAARLSDGAFSTLISFDGELMRLEAAHNWTPEAFDHLSHRILPAPPSRALPAGRAILDCIVIDLPDIELAVL